MKALSDFFSRVLPFVPGCPEPTAQQALVDSAIAFCKKSLVLRQKLDPFFTADGVRLYELEPPEQHLCVMVLNVWVDGTAIRPWPAELGIPTFTTSGTPQRYFSTYDDEVLTLGLYPMPDSSLQVEVEVALMPTRGATELADKLFNYWIEPVTNGAIGRIMSIPAQPFTSAGATAYMQMAAAQTTDARLVGMTGRAQSSLSIQMRPLA